MNDSLLVEKTDTVVILENILEIAQSYLYYGKCFIKLENKSTYFV